MAKAMDTGISATQRLNIHEKNAWMLRSLLKK